MRLYLDEDQPRDLAGILRERGIETLEPTEVGLRAAFDPVQFDFAIREGRVLVTSNARDYALLAKARIASGMSHPGLVFSTQESLPVLLRRLLRFVATESVVSMTNRIVWLNTYR